MIAKKTPPGKDRCSVSYMQEMSNSIQEVYKKYASMQYKRPFPLLI
jgi:hypothetical protein